MNILLYMANGTLQLGFNKGPWLGEINLDYSSGPHLITWVIKSRKKERSFPSYGQRELWLQQNVKEMCLCWHWRWRMGVMSQGLRAASRRLGKARNRFSSRTFWSVLWKGTLPCRPPGIRLPTYGTTLCCLKPEMCVCYGSNRRLIQ